MYTHKQAHIHIYTHKHTHTGIHIYAHTHSHKFIPKHIHIHTRTQTHIRTNTHNTCILRVILTNLVVLRLLKSQSDVRWLDIPNTKCDTLQRLYMNKCDGVRKDTGARAAQWRQTEGRQSRLNSRARAARPDQCRSCPVFTCLRHKAPRKPSHIGDKQPARCNAS